MITRGIHDRSGNCENGRRKDGLKPISWGMMTGEVVEVSVAGAMGDAKRKGGVLEA